MRARGVEAEDYRTQIGKLTEAHANQETFELHQVRRTPPRRPSGGRTRAGAAAALTVGARRQLLIAKAMNELEAGEQATALLEFNAAVRSLPHHGSHRRLYSSASAFKRHAISTAWVLPH